jgi:drug/metabolite transporter (DMT)-like permease
VVIFAGSLPATRLAVRDFQPDFLTFARASIAAVLGFALLMALRQRRPGLADLPSLAITALGCVLGFPLLTGLALQQLTSAHSVVFMGILPLCTAVFAVLRGGERPRSLFWLFAVAGSAFIVGFAAFNSMGASLYGDLLMLAAIVVCGLGYAEGATLARKLGGWQVICWALVLALPVMLPLAWLSMPASFAHVGLPAWAGFAYVTLFSMLIGFFFWYRGLAQGGIAAVGQLQLLQPFLGFALAAMLLHESVSWAMLGVTVGAVVCVAGARRYAH